MDITRFEPKLLGFGLTQDQVDELKAAAAKLPPGLEDGSLIDIPQFPGLSLHESELLVARLLEKVALELGVPIEDPTFYDDLRFPTLEELVSRVNHARECARV